MKKKNFIDKSLLILRCLGFYFLLLLYFDSLWLDYVLQFISFSLLVLSLRIGRICSLLCTSCLFLCSVFVLLYSWIHFNLFSFICDYFHSQFILHIQPYSHSLLVCLFSPVCNQPPTSSQESITPVFLLFFCLPFPAAFFHCLPSLLVTLCSLLCQLLFSFCQLHFHFLKLKLPNLFVTRTICACFCFPFSRFPFSSYLG